MNFFCIRSIFWMSLLLKAGAPGGGNAERYLPGQPVVTDACSQTEKEIPVLCYHNIKPLKNGNSPDYTIDPRRFYEHIKMLSDSGYTAILPDQLVAYLATGKAVPSKSVMISFDDSREDHFSTAAPVLERFGYRGVFFIMTVTIGKTGYLPGAQIKQLSDRGHVIAGHSWDHPNLKNLDEKEWDIQIARSKAQLEKITGRPVEYFAYPYGAWDDKVISELEKRGIQAAFQLSGKKSKKQPLYTIRRLMVNGNWTATELYKRMKISFQQ